MPQPDLEDYPLAPEDQLSTLQALYSIALLYSSMAVAGRALTDISGGLAQVGFAYTRRLATAYYRLQRALWTGRTIPLDEEESGGRTSIARLYQEFEQIAYQAIPESKRKEVQRVISEPSTANGYIDNLVPQEEGDEEDAPPPILEAVKGDWGNPKTDLAESAGTGETSADSEEWDEEERIILEQIEEAEEALRAIDAAWDAESRELQATLEAIAKKERLDDYRLMKSEAAKRISPKVAAKRRRRAKEKARGKRAALAAKVSQAGARAVTSNLTRADGRSIGFVRVPYGPNPCGFCLMLASRGALLYKSRQSAGREWHPNCYCGAEPVFSKDHYFKSPLFAKNRALHMMWKDVTKGAGAAGMGAWRKHFRDLYANGKHINAILDENARKHS